MALEASRGEAASNSNVATYFFIYRISTKSDLSKKFAGKISKQLAQAIICESRLGQRRYQIQKNMLKKSDLDILPTWKDVAQFRLSVTPAPIDIKTLDDVFIGIHYSFIESIKLTANQIIKAEKIQTTPKLTLIIKYGWDGSSGHKVFNQLDNIDSDNIIQAALSPLRLIDPESKNILWENQVPNSEFSQRPVLMVLGKETSDNVDNLKVLEPERKTLEQDGITLEGGSILTVMTKNLCLDRKAANI